MVSRSGETCCVERASSLSKKVSRPKNCSDSAHRCLSWLLFVRLAGCLRDVVACYLAAGCAPHTFMLTDVLQSRVKRVDAIWHAGQVRVNGDGHNASRFFALAIEHVELAANHLLKFSCGLMLMLKGWLVVDVMTVWKRYKSAATFEIHHVGLIVVAPITNIFHAFGGEKVECVPGFLQARTQPSGRAYSGSTRDRRQAVVNNILLFAGRRIV